MRIRVVLLLTLSPAVSLAQGAPGMRIATDIRIASTEVRNGTTCLSYILTNRPQSEEQLFMFTVDAPAGAPEVITRHPARIGQPPIVTAGGPLRGGRYSGPRRSPAKARLSSRSAVSVCRAS